MQRYHAPVHTRRSRPLASDAEKCGLQEVERIETCGTGTIPGIANAIVSDAWDRDLGGRGSTSDRDRNEERDPRDVFTKDLDLPRGRERRPVRERDRVYEIDGAESRTLATIGAFRVVAESDLHDIRDDSAELAAKPQASREAKG